MCNNQKNHSRDQLLCFNLLQKGFLSFRHRVIHVQQDVWAKQKKTHEIISITATIVVFTVPHSIKVGISVRRV